MLALLWPVPVSLAQETEENLVRISLNIFPKLVAVDLGMKDKLTSQGEILLQVYYRKKEELARQVVSSLEEKYSKIATYPVRVEAIDQLTSITPTAILVVEHLPDSTIKKLIAYGIQNHILLFSPFKEDVDRGITAGMYMAIRILPYFNRETLNQSGIQMHQIIMRSARIYE